MINRKHKDRLFTKIFGAEENKSNLLELYNALNDTDLSLMRCSFAFRYASCSCRAGALCIFAEICLLVSKLPTGNSAHLRTACSNAQIGDYYNR